MSRRTNGSTCSPRAIALALAVAACGGPATGSAEPSLGANTSPPTTPSHLPSAAAAPASAPVELRGRLVFGRYDTKIADMTVWVARGDGSEAARLVPGAHFIVCITGDGRVVMAGPDASGLLVISTVALDGTGYGELPSPDGHLNFGVGTCLPDERVAVEAWDNDDPERAGIYVVDVSGSAEPNRITTPSAGTTDIPGCVTRDGNIAFLRAPLDNRPGSLMLVLPDGTDERRIGSDTYTTGPSCSADGRLLLAEAGGDLFLVDVSDGSRRQITSAEPGFGEHKYLPWFAGGDVIMFSLLHPGPYHDLYAMRLDGTGLTRLTHSPGVDNESPRLVLDP